MLTAVLGPRLVEVLRQQRAAVARGRRGGRTRRSAGERLLRDPLEDVDVDDHLRCGQQRDGFVAENDRRPVLTQGATGVVGDFVQARGRVRDGEVGPQPVDELFPMQPTPRGEGEQLHQRGRLWPWPAGRRNGRTVEQHLEAAEHSDLDLGGSR
jgi:hypothetical protein